MNVYDIGGNIIVDEQAIFDGNMTLDYAFDSASNANYTVIRVFQTKTDGTKQYPFARTPTLSTPYKSTLDLARAEGWYLAINAWGIFADGLVIENGIVKRNTPATYHAGSLPLTIDDDGLLSSAAADADGDVLVANGIVSAVTGFCPIIVDFAPVSPLPTISNATHFAQNAQRQIIGQFDNGDYAIITCEGRDYAHSDGWTIAEAQTICQKLGLKFAYNLDGGGSTETCIGKKQINTIYENETGRKCQTFIVFNGTDTFAVPS